MKDLTQGSITKTFAAYVGIFAASMAGADPYLLVIFIGSDTSKRSDCWVGVAGTS